MGSRSKSDVPQISSTMAGLGKDSMTSSIGDLNEVCGRRSDEAVKCATREQKTKESKAHIKVVNECMSE